MSDLVLLWSRRGRERRWAATGTTTTGYRVTASLRPGTSGGYRYWASFVIKRPDGSTLTTGAQGDSHFRSLQAWCRREALRLVRGRAGEGDDCKMRPPVPGSWGYRAHAVIRETALVYLDAVGKLPAELTEAELAELDRLVRSAYPFGERAMFPYKAWCREIKRFRQEIAALRQPPRAEARQGTLFQEPEELVLEVCR